MRLFGGDRLKSMMQRLNVPEDVPLENGMVSRSIESAQKRVEGRNFDTRRHVVQYDDVMSRHREIMYKRRQKLLEKIAGKSVSDLPLHKEVTEMIKREVGGIADEHIQGDDRETWNVAKFRETMGALHPDLSRVISEEEMKTMETADEVKEFTETMLLNFYETKLKHYGQELADKAEQIIVLHSIDTHWMDHIDTMAHLREQVAFAGYAQRDPLIEYQDQGFQLFQKLLAAIASTTVRALLQADFAQFAAPQAVTEEPENLETNEAEIESALEQLGASLGDKKPKATKTIHLNANPDDKVGRNDPCPCGSGKKYKKCHGKEGV
jgi:preprotein translocase subunit SecA